MRVVPLKKAEMARIIKIRSFWISTFLTTSHLLVFGDYKCKTTGVHYFMHPLLIILDPPLNQIVEVRVGTLEVCI